LPDEVGYDQGAMVEPLAVAAHATSRTEELSGKKILVLGAGPIGNLVAQTSLALGAREVMITDISNYRLEIAKRAVQPPVNLGFLQRKELRLIGTHMYQESDFRRAIDMLESGAINTELLISDNFPFAQYLEAYKYIEKQKDRVMKVIVRIGDAA
jgi:threonine dehydrogenase-like Zn-dependent dehydrogenase